MTTENLGYNLSVNTGQATTIHWVSSDTDPMVLATLGARMLKQGVITQFHVSQKTKNLQNAPNEDALLFAGVLIDATKWREQNETETAN